MYCKGFINMFNTAVLGTVHSLLKKKTQRKVVLTFALIFEIVFTTLQLPQHMYFFHKITLYSSNPH